MPKIRRNGEGSISLRKDGRWEVRISGCIDFATGKPVRISRYAASEEDAVKLLHTLSYQMEAKAQKLNHMTLGQWLDTWLEIYMQHSLKQSTYNSYSGYAKNHFKPALGNMRLEELSPRVLQHFYNYKMETEGLAPKTIRNLNLYLHKALGQAQKEGLILQNPATGVNLPRGHRPKVEVLTRDEQAQLVRASYRHRYGVFVRFVLMTGIRLGELLGLRWEDIDFRTNMVHIRRTLNRLQKVGVPDDQIGNRTEIVIQEPKTENSQRSMPILPQIIQELLQWRKVQEGDAMAAGDTYADSGMIVTNPSGCYIEPRTFSEYYHQMLTMAGLRHFTFHALRHTFATRALEQGMDEKTLSTILGHYSVAFTLDTYAHVLNDHMWQGMNLMEELCCIDQTIPQHLAYPAVVTAEAGTYRFDVPDFPEIYYTATSVEEGVCVISEALRQAVATLLIPPAPSGVTDLMLVASQFVLQVVL